MADTQTLHGLDEVLAKLKSLPPEIVSKRGGPVKSALRKGGLVVQKAAQANIRAIVQKPEEDAGYVSTGLLENAVVVRRDPNPQRSEANERYRVLLARRTYPDGTKTVATGRYLEFGTEKRAPTPWMTPAYFGTRQQALDTVVTELTKSIRRIVRKMEKAR